MQENDYGYLVYFEQLHYLLVLVHITLQREKVEIIGSRVKREKEYLL